MCILFSVSFLPVYSPEASGEFGSGGFVVRYAGTTETVTRTVFRTRAIYVIMWTGHDVIPFLHDFSCKDTTFFADMQFFLHICSKMIYGYLRVSSDKQTVENSGSRFKSSARGKNYLLTVGLKKQSSARKLTTYGS